MRIIGLQYTGVSISLVLGTTPLSFMRGDPQFDEVLSVVKSAMAEGNLESEEVGALVDEIVHKYLNTARKLVDLPGTNVSYRDGEIYIGETPMAGFTANRLIQLIDEATAAGEDPVLFALPLAKFIQQLEAHPWNTDAAGYHERRMFQDLRQDLYRFLEKGSMPLTSDGCFLAYRSVDPDWYSKHSGDLRGTTGSVIRVNGVETDCTVPGVVGSGHGQIRNQVGDTPRIPLNMVNPDRNVTCSYGLHVGSANYPWIANPSAGDHVIVVKVNPRDVGSIPVEYGDSKMRVCAYEIVGEYTEYFQREYASRAVVTRYDGDDEEGDADLGHIDIEEMPELEDFIREKFNASDLVSLGRQSRDDVKATLTALVDEHIATFGAVEYYVALDDDTRQTIDAYIEDLLSALGF